MAPYSGGSGVDESAVALYAAIGSTTISVAVMAAIAKAEIRLVKRIESGIPWVMIGSDRIERFRPLRIRGNRRRHLFWADMTNHSRRSRRPLARTRDGYRAIVTSARRQVPWQASGWCFITSQSR